MLSSTRRGRSRRSDSCQESCQEPKPPVLTTLPTSLFFPGAKDET